MQRLFQRCQAKAVALFAGVLLAFPALGQEVVTVWSHWADQEAKVKFVEEAAKRFEAKHPGVKVKITWYQKNPLFQALQSALRAGQGPDVFYLDPDRVEYIENKLILPLDDLLDWNNIEPWARGPWTHGGKTYALPLEVQTIELYYNKDLMQKLGVTIPGNGRLSQPQFLDLVKKASAAGITPVVQGVADRDFPGAYLLQEMLLKKLGVDDYGKLLTGKLSFKDPRVVAVFTYIKQLVDAGAYPKSLTSLTLGESHTYFYGKPGGLMLPMGSWYTSRAFNPPDKGGQPENFPLAIMQFPVPDGAACPECKTNAVAGSFVINAASKHPKLAAEFLNEMATPEMGTKWLVENLVATGVKSDPSAIKGKYADYFKQLAARNSDVKYFTGIPIGHMRGQCLDTYKQVMNTGFPAGLLSADRAISMMDAACYKA
ncbi:MAG: ABC transporter substrate-binding protein [Betaproteobacteria bacterium]